MRNFSRISHAIPQASRGGAQGPASRPLAARLASPSALRSLSTSSRSLCSPISTQLRPSSCAPAFRPAGNARLYSTEPPKPPPQQPQQPPEPHSSSSGKKKHSFFGAVKATFGWLGVLVAVPLGYFIAFVIYDSTTYQGGPSLTDVAIPIDSSHSKRGGPKNSLVASSFVDDVELGHTAEKPRSLILGSGWGSVASSNKLDTSQYNVTSISPTNHFSFTPSSPSAAVGTSSLDTLVEPMRHICQKKNVRFLQAAAHDVDFDGRSLEVRSEDANSHETHFYIPYDKLVIATGASTNTHGVKGLENCSFFKTAADCEKSRASICRNLEIATSPSTSEAERRRLSSFVICGGGPTGVESASEIYDSSKEDVSKMYPHSLVNLASVHIIQSRSAISNTYDETISRYAMDRFMKDGIDSQTNARVQEVHPESVSFTKTNDNGEKQMYTVPSGLTSWTTGVGSSRFVQRVMANLSEYQHNRRAIETDSHSRVLGTRKGEVYAIGDCSTVRHSLANESEASIRAKLKEQVDVNDEYELKTIDDCLTQVSRNEPSARIYSFKSRDKLHKWYKPEDRVHSNRVVDDSKKVNSKLTTLPATAQRANQQGIYMAGKSNRLAMATPEMIKDVEDVDSALSRAFSYHHLGSLAYVSNAAVFDTGDQIGFNFFGGVMAMYLWRSVYMSQTVTYRARVHMFFDWSYRGSFGRQIYSYDRVAKNIENQD